MDTDETDESFLTMDDGDETKRTPDLSVFVHKRDARKLKYSYPPLNIELKFPTEPQDVLVLSADESDPAKEIATKTMRVARTQICAQAEHIFEEYTLEFFPEFTTVQIWAVVGTFFQVFKFSRAQTDNPKVSAVNNIFNKERSNFSRSFNSSWKLVVADCSVSDHTPTCQFAPCSFHVSPHFLSEFNLTTKHTVPDS